MALILNEHHKLSIENPLLKEEIEHLKYLNNLCEEKDSIRQQEISEYETELTNTTKNIKKLKSTQKKLIIGSSVGGIILFIIGLIL